MTRRLTDELARKAWGVVEGVVEGVVHNHSTIASSFATLARNLPADLQASGLMATVSVLQAHRKDNNEHALVLSGLSAALDAPNVGLDGGQLTTTALLGLSEEQRRLAQRIAVEYAVWLKRASDAVIGTASGRGGRGRGEENDQEEQA